jgi:acetate CoA/acetoacetate CoA-transferase alpha subunit
MNKLSNKETIRALIKDGASIMVGGFLGCGAPEKLIDILLEMNVQNLTLIGNDSGFVDRSVGRLIVNGQVSKVIASHIGTNPETGRLLNEGKMQVELVPQGTLVERIRAAGSGLGGVLTPTGVGTMVEEGKQKITVNGREYLLELPLRADFAFLKGSVADELGNTFYRGTTRNFNPIMALAADTVILETDELVKVGELRPEDVMTPCVLVDYILVGDKQ